MRRSKAAYILFCVIFCAHPAAGQDLDWPRWRGPDGNGVSQETDWNTRALSGDLRILWKASIGQGFSSMSVLGDHLYAMGNDGATDTVFCIEAGTGRVVWEHSYPCALGSYPGPRATPAVHAGIVYTLSQEGHLFALDAATGQVKWQRNLSRDFKAVPPTWNFAGSPVVAGDRLILNAGRAGLALDLKTGARIWDSGSGRGGYATPVIAQIGGRTIALIFGERALYGVDTAKGTQLWSFPWQTGSDVNAADPLVFGSRIFISSAYDKGCALIDLSSGSPVEVWRNHSFESHFSSFVLINGTIYGIDGDARSQSAGTLRAVDAGTGAPAWTTRTGFGSLIASGERLIVLSGAGAVIVVEASPAGYRELARSSLPRSQYWTPPVLSHGRLFVRNLVGDLFAIDVR